MSRSKKPNPRNLPQREDTAPTSDHQIDDELSSWYQEMLRSPVPDRLRKLVERMRDVDEQDV